MIIKLPIKLYLNLNYSYLLLYLASNKKNINKKSISNYKHLYFLFKNRKLIYNI